MATPIASPLPNSGITRPLLDHITGRTARIADPWTSVDIATPLTFADYAAGRDPALEAALAYRSSAVASGTAPRRVAAERRRRHARGPGNVAWQRIQPLRQSRLPAAPRRRSHDDGQREAGLAAAELAARYLPDNVDASNVLAHLAEAAGKPDLARQAGTRVLELDPNNRLARSLLERVAARNR